MRYLLTAAICGILLLSVLLAGGEDKGFPAVPTPEQARAKGLEVATFAAGCFWCAESPFEGLPGVQSVVSGYTGGKFENPTYQAVSSGGTGHAEAVQVVYDPKIVTYDRLLYIFWRNVDPFAKGGQFCDYGSQYRAGIFVHDARQRKLAEGTRAEVAKRFGQTVHVEVTDASRFWPAENYHQDYCFKNPLRYKTYRAGCGRDTRLREIWGDEAAPHGDKK
jgi:peptide-methionine (S)-S-oxide reductase